jgi:SSS family solute:Na+ symporter
VNPAASDGRVLSVARAAAFGGGALGIGLAIVSPSVIGALSIFYTLLSVSLFVPVIAGLYLRRVGTPEVFAAIATGVCLMLVAQLATAGRGFGVLTPALLGILGAVAGCAVMLLLRRRRRAQGT